MTSRISALSIDAHDPETLAGFWCAALDYVVTEADVSGVSIEPRDPTVAGLAIDFFSVPEGKTVKNRLHVDLRADGSTQNAELERLIALGATRVDVGQGPDVSWVVFADPEGNEFCLLSRSVQDVSGA